MKRLRRMIARNVQDKENARMKDVLDQLAYVEEELERARMTSPA